MTERENLLRTLRRESPEWIPMEQKSMVLIDPSCLRDRVENGYDSFGVKWIESVTDISAARVLPDITKWREVIKFPDVESLDWEGSAKADLAGIDRESKALWIPFRRGPFERLHSLMGFEDALCSLLEEPDEVKAFVSVYADYRIACIRKAVEYYKPDIMSIHDDYGTQISLFMAPGAWREIIKPSLKRMFDAIRENGIIGVLHSCGKLDEIAGDFVELGIDVWDSFQACCDRNAIYARYGDKMAFTPSPDMQKAALITDNEEIRQMVRDTIDSLSKYGNVMIRAPHPTAVSREHGDIINDEIEKYGRDYYV